MTDMSTMEEMERTNAVATQLLQRFRETLLAAAPKVDLGEGVTAAAVVMDHAALVGMIIETISETWFYHPELLGGYVGEMHTSKLAGQALSREKYDELARAETFIIAAALAGTLDTDDLPEQLGRMGFGPHAVDD